MRQVGHMTCMMEKQKAYRVLERKKEGKRQSGRPSHKWEVNTKMNLKKNKIGWHGLH